VWERRQREFNEKIEMVNRDLQEQEEKAEKRLQDEWENTEAWRISLSECLQSATNQYQGIRNQGIRNEYCKKLNQQDNYLLPSNTAGALKQRHSQMRKERYRLNPQ
jgi:hypothetical protein